MSEKLEGKLQVEGMTCPLSCYMHNVDWLMENYIVMTITITLATDNKIIM